MSNCILVLFFEAKFQRRLRIFSHKWKVFLPIKHIFTIPGYAYTAILCHWHIIISHCVSFSPIHQLYGYRSFRKKWMVPWPWEERRSNSADSIVCVSDFLVCVPFLLRNSSKNIAPINWISLLYCCIFVWFVYIWTAKAGDNKQIVKMALTFSRNLKNILK